MTRTRSRRCCAMRCARRFCRDSMRCVRAFGPRHPARSTWWPRRPRRFVRSRTPTWRRRRTAPRTACCGWTGSLRCRSRGRPRLLELLEQARTARSDARLLVRVGDREVRRYRGLLLLKEADTVANDVQSFRWRGESEVSVPGWGGALRFRPVVDEEGFDPEWLGQAILEVRPRGGGERFKPHPTRPSRTLKRLFQDAGIPEFERGRLPLLWRKGELIYVAGLGADVRMTDRDGARVVIEWHPDAGLIDRIP